MNEKKRIVVIGGGTGTFVALTGLKKYPVHLSAIITMMDSGGSTGRLRDQLGVLPPGDLRQALVALAESDKLWRDLFLYRFVNGDLKGHNFGNIFISALEKVTGSIEAAVECAAMILDTHGDVIPVTFANSQLCVELSDGKLIKGETHIDEPEEMEERPRIKRAFLEPHASANKRAIEAIEKADMIVIGPGDLYTIIIPNILVRGMRPALEKSKAKKVFVMNLMTKYGQTTNYTAADHIHDLEHYMGPIDAVLINSKRPHDPILDRYKRAQETIVVNDLDVSTRKIISASLIDNKEIHKTSSDSLKRSVIRHHPDRLAKKLISLL
ncbi:MAG: YvcK family protein [Candidatus Roizmanbacteria bacterium]|nr:YvcK family protein [Candidatus Roizmanbacteria bacterium]